MLTSLGARFDMLNEEQVAASSTSLTDYRLVILPWAPQLDQRVARAVRQAVEAGATNLLGLKDTGTRDETGHLLPENQQLTTLAGLKQVASRESSWAEETGEAGKSDPAMARLMAWGSLSRKQGFVAGQIYDVADAKILIQHRDKQDNPSPAATEAKRGSASVYWLASSYLSSGYYVYSLTDLLLLEGILETSLRDRGDLIARSGRYPDGQQAAMVVRSDTEGVDAYWEVHKQSDVKNSPYYDENWDPVNDGKLEEKKAQFTIDLFKRLGFPVTHYVTGSYAKEYPDLIQAYVKAGHEIAAHGLHHFDPTVGKPYGPGGTDSVTRWRENFDAVLSILQKEAIPYRRGIALPFTKSALEAMQASESFEFSDAFTAYWGDDTLTFGNLYPARGIVKNGSELRMVRTLDMPGHYLLRNQVSDADRAALDKTYEMGGTYTLIVHTHGIIAPTHPQEGMYKGIESLLGYAVQKHNWWRTTAGSLADYLNARDNVDITVAGDYVRIQNRNDEPMRKFTLWLQNKGPVRALEDKDGKRIQLVPATQGSFAVLDLPPRSDVVVKVSR
ncbi:MAG TPA: polysaccharide deacetylase family protein [Symbiobacteriaceae bacterium]|jgi:peptidoglycan/xylan/chitin deacetylase (PgdA/CDA1 family)